MPNTMAGKEEHAGWIDMGNITGENVEKDPIDVEDRDPTMHSITFSTSSSWPNSICWSLDDRIAVLTDTCIYVLKISSSNKRKKHGSPIGMQFEHYYIGNQKTKIYDEELEKSLREISNSPKLEVKQQILFDRAMVWRKDILSQNDSYCGVKWSPLGCECDGRCVLATLTASGIVRIHHPAPATGIWYECIDITASLHKYLLQTNWFITENVTSNEGLQSSVTSDDNLEEGRKQKDNHDEYQKISNRKHLLFTTVMCWGSILWHCHHCLSNALFDNIYYTSYFVNYAKCKHAKSPFLTASKNGYIFVWLITFNVENELLHNAEVLLQWSTDFYNPVSLAWHQINPDEAFVAVGFARGFIRIYRLSIKITLDGKYICHLVQTVEVWNEQDMISVSFLHWILPMDSVLRLVCSKGTDIIITTLHKDDDGTLVCLSCEVGPCCHASPITSLQCISHKYVLSSSRASTQYFDIENESLHLCENNVLRGFKCFGVTSASNMTMLARVCCPNRLLLQQNSYVKQMEVSFLPFLSTDFIAERLVDESIHLDICVREYISICSAEQFVLPQILHKYCTEPATYEISLHELQMYLYFNQLRYMQQSGMRVCSLTREEVDADLVSDDFNDQVTTRIERAIAVHFYREMLSKCLQLLENSWVKETVGGALALILMADWLCQTDVSHDALHLPYKCFSLLRETTSLNALKDLQESMARGGNVGQFVKKEKDTTTDENEIIAENENQPDQPIVQTIKKENNTGGDFNELDVYRKWDLPREKCPFCNVDISLHSLKNFKCINDHVYFRCCLTLRISMKGKYRQCVGCGRKASQKCFDSELNIDSVLLNIDLCPFCGCRFVDYNR